MKRYRLKKQYKYTLIILSLAAILYGAFIIYDARREQTNGQQPGSIQIFNK